MNKSYLVSETKHDNNNDDDDDDDINNNNSHNNENSNSKKKKKEKWINKLKKPNLEWKKMKNREQL